MKKALFSLVAFLFSANCVLAQSVRQSGPVTPGHPVMWITNGVAGDGGVSTNGFLTSIGVMASGPGICQQSGPITGPYNQICLSVGLGVPSQIQVQNFGGATAQPLNFSINGTAYSFPFTGPGTGIIGPGSSVIGVPTCWNSTIGAALQTCPLDAAGQAGGDMGAKINAAIALLPAGGGIVDATGLTGNQTLSTAVTIPANSTLLMGVAAITQSASITVGQASSLICQPTGQGQGNNFGQTRFFQNVGANLNGMINVAGGQAVVKDCVVDGNKASGNNTSGTNINITNSHFNVSGVTSQNSPGAGITLFSSGVSDAAAVGVFNRVTSVANAGDGLLCQGTADTQIELSSFENNAGAAGIELNNCPTTRMTNYDVGGNVIGLWIYGNNSTGLGSNGQIIGHGQFGNQSAQDILIDGTNGGSYGNLISGAYFFGSIFRTSNTYAAIDLHDMTVGGNLIGDAVVQSIAGHTYSNAVYIHGSEGPDTVSNVRTMNAFGGVTFNLASNTTTNSACDTTSALCRKSQNVNFSGVFGGPTFATALTLYLGPAGFQQFSEAGTWQVAPGTAGVITFFNCATSNVPGAGHQWTWQIAKNGSLVGNTFVTTAAAFGTGDVAVGNIAVTAHDLIAMSVTADAAAATIPSPSCTIQMN